MQNLLRKTDYTILFFTVKLNQSSSQGRSENRNSEREFDVADLPNIYTDTHIIDTHYFFIWGWGGVGNKSKIS